MEGFFHSQLGKPHHTLRRCLRMKHAFVRGDPGPGGPMVCMGPPGWPGSSSSRLLVLPLRRM
jgi:hypothetical protein